MINQMEPHYGDREKEALESYLNSGGWLTEYQETRAFEDRLADFVGSEFAHAASNGTIGLLVAMMALDLDPGDEVILPDFTHIATAYAVELAGATPVLVDIDPETLCIDPDHVSEALSADTAAIVYVSLNGRSHGIDRVASIAERNELFLVEDAAQSLGSRHDGDHLGTVGDVGVFSFSYAKIITTGQGGMIVTDDPDLSERVGMIRDFGRPEGGVDRYEILGLNAKFTDVQAAIGLAQMERLKDRIARKKEMYREYRNQLGDITELRFPETDLEQTPPWFVDVIVDSGERAELIRALKSADIGSRPFYPPIHTQGPYAELTGPYPSTKDVSRNGLWLPSSPKLESEQIDRICDEIRGFFMG